MLPVARPGLFATIMFLRFLLAWTSSSTR